MNINFTVFNLFYSNCYYYITVNFCKITEFGKIKKYFKLPKIDEIDECFKLQKFNSIEKYFC